MIRLHGTVKIRIRVIESDMVVFESVGTSRNIDTEEILIIPNLVPEVKSSRSVTSDELLGIDEVSYYRLDSKLLDKLSFESCFSRFARFECTPREAIKSTSSRSACCLGEEYFPFMKYNSPNFRASEIFFVVHVILIVTI